MGAGGGKAMAGDAKKKIRARAIKPSAESVGLCIGLGSFFCWFWSVMQNPNIPVRQGAENPGHALYWTIVLASAALSFFAILLLAKKVPAEKRRFVESRVTAVLLAVFTVVSYVPRLSGMETLGSEYAEIVTVGLLAAWLFVQWGSIVGNLGPRRLLTVSSASLLVSFAVAVVFYHFEASLATTLLTFLPFASSGAMFACRASGWGVDPVGSEPSAEAAKAGAWHFYVTVLVQGMAFGLLHLLYSTITLEQCSDPYCPLRFLNAFFPLVSVGDFYGFMSIFGVALAAGIVLLSTTVLRLNFRKLIYVVGFPLMAVGFLILASDTGFRLTEVVSHASGVNFTAGEVVYIAGYYYVVVTTWALCSYLVRMKKGDRVTVFARSGLALVSGQLLGFLSSMVVGFEHLSRADFCTMAIFLLMLASLLIATNDRLWSEWGGVRPNEADRPSAFRVACEAVARRYRLTEREQDVLILLARGRNMSFIADKLCVTKDTVKTHCRSLYRKLEVHSQQELIDKIEAEIGVDKDQRLFGGS